MNLEQKIEALTLRLGQEPHSRVFAPLADLLRQAGKLEEALDLLDDGLSRHPEYCSALVIKGQTLLDAGKLDQARQVLIGVLGLDPENIVVLRLLTEDARSRGAWEEAIPLLEKLVVLDPDDEGWSGALREAKGFLDGGLPTGDVDFSFATMTLVDIYLAQGYRDKALEALARMAARDPGRAEIQQRIAEIQSVGLSVPKGLGEVGQMDIPSVGESAGEGSLGNAARRSQEKKQFGEWIDRLRQDDGTSP